MTMMPSTTLLRAIAVALALAASGCSNMAKPGPQSIAGMSPVGTVRMNEVIAAGATAGTGTLVFQGRSYPLAIGGVSYGFTFGASSTDFVGTVTNIRRPTDVNGVYGAAGAGVAVGAGAGGIVLTNQNGAILTLAGRQAGLIVAADLNGLVITLR